MIRVIINADDLGKSHVVNAAIDEALTTGVISSATILANSECWEEVHQIIGRHPNASFGIHLNLTEGKALTNNPVLYKSVIVDENFVFTKKVRNLRSYTPEILNAVKEEWEAQIKKAIVTEGIKVSHVDGHHHIHTFFPFRNILSELLNKYGITKIRNRYNYPQNKVSTFIYKAAAGILNYLPGVASLRSVTNPYIKLAYNLVENLRWRKQIGMRFPLIQYFGSYEHFCDVSRFIDKNGNATIELMCHPGHPKFENEYREIREHKLEKLIPFRLISYKEI